MTLLKLTIPRAMDDEYASKASFGSDWREQQPKSAVLSMNFPKVMAGRGAAGWGKERRKTCDAFETDGSARNGR